MKVKFKKVRPFAKMPVFGHDDPSNAALDMSACLANHSGDAIEFIVIRPYEWVKVGLGVAWEPGNPGKGNKAALILKGRSGLASEGITLVNAGVIDQGYRGEISAILKNEGATTFFLNNGDRIVQGMVVSIPDIEVVEADELSESARGENGFGSSGR